MAPFPFPANHTFPTAEWTPAIKLPHSPLHVKPELLTCALQSKIHYSNICISRHCDLQSIIFPECSTPNIHEQYMLSIELAQKGLIIFTGSRKRLTRGICLKWKWAHLWIPKPVQTLQDLTFETSSRRNAATAAPMKPRTTKTCK